MSEELVRIMLDIFRFTFSNFIAADECLHWILLEPPQSNARETNAKKSNVMEIATD